MAQRAATTPWQYSANAGHLSLRKKLCEGTPFDPKTEVCVTAGTQEGLFAVFTAFVNPGDEVLVPDPGFLSYATLAKICGATAGDVRARAARLARSTSTRCEKNITPKTKLIIVNSPSNPLGAVVDARDAASASPHSDRSSSATRSIARSGTTRRPRRCSGMRRERDRAERPLEEPRHDRPPPRMDPREANRS